MKMALYYLLLILKNNKKIVFCNSISVTAQSRRSENRRSASAELTTPLSPRHYQIVRFISCAVKVNNNVLFPEYDRIGGLKASQRDVTADGDSESYLRFSYQVFSS